jgi:hypothetical protein
MVEYGLLRVNRAPENGVSESTSVNAGTAVPCPYGDR